MSISEHEVETVKFGTRRGFTNEFIERAPEVLPHLAADIKATWRDFIHWDALAHEPHIYNSWETAFDEERDFVGKRYFEAIAQLRRYGQLTAYLLAETDPEQYAQIVAINAENNLPFPKHD